MSRLPARRWWSRKPFRKVPRLFRRRSPRSCPARRRAGSRAASTIFSTRTGGWGWWAGRHQPQHDRLRVAYGLACCKLTGTAGRSNGSRPSLRVPQKRTRVQRAGHVREQLAHGGMALAGRDLEGARGGCWRIANAASAERAHHASSRPGPSPIDEFLRALQISRSRARIPLAVAELGETPAASAYATRPQSAEELALATQRPDSRLRRAAERLQPHRRRDCSQSARACTGRARKSRATRSKRSRGCCATIRAAPCRSPPASRSRGKNLLAITDPANAQGFSSTARMWRSAQLSQPRCREHRDDPSMVPRSVGATRINNERGTQRLDKSRPDRRGDCAAGAKLLDARRQAAGSPRTRPGESSPRQLVVLNLQDATSDYLIIEERAARPVFEFAA